MIVCADIRAIERDSPLSHMAFFVECDGLVGHAENAGQVQADLDDERAIRAATGLPVLGLGEDRPAAFAQRRQRLHMGDDDLPHPAAGTSPPPC